MRSIKIAFRNSFLMDKMSLLNFAGLSIGILSTLILALFIWAEFGHDTYFPGYKNIYRITTDYKKGGAEAHWALNHGIIDQELEDKLPGIESSTAFIGAQAEKIFYAGNLATVSDKGFYVDEDFFDVFQYEFIHGNRAASLGMPNSVVVTSSFAHKMFGTDEVLNREIFQEINEKSPLIITGVIKDIPFNSYLKFDYIISGRSYPDWDVYYSGEYGNTFYIFFKTQPNIEEAGLQSQVDRSLELIKKQLFGKDYEPPEAFRMDNIVQRIDDIYFNAKNEFEISAGGNLNYTLLVLLVGIFILMICIINHVNLSISSSFSKKKIKEFAIKRLVGSSRVSLLSGFLMEVAFSVLGAILVSLVVLRFIVDLWAPVENMIVNPFSSPNFYLVLLAAWIFISISTALFPAIKFMSFNIISASKGKIDSGNSSFFSVRNSLVVIQVVVTVLLLSNSSLLYRQLDYLINLDPGYDTEQIIEVKRTSNMTDAAWKDFLNRSKNLSSIAAVGSSNFKHISDASNATVVADVPESPQVKITWNSIDYDFMSALNLNILKGRPFSPDVSSDTAEVIINEMAAAAFELENPVGVSIIMWGRPLKIVGVVNDFHFQSFTKPISPTLLLLNVESTNLAYIKHTSNSRDVIAGLENIWYQSNPDSPFEYTFLNDNYEQLVEKEKETAGIVTAFTFVAIILAALGLIGMIGNDAIQKTKEIAIKKILGAPTRQIILLLNRRFVLILLAGFLLSIPLAIWTGNYWLQLFAYKVSVSNTDFIFSLICIALVGSAVSSLITFNATSSNPVHVIRNE